MAERTPLVGAGIRVRPLGEEVVAEDAAPTVPATIALTAERRAKLIAFVESNTRMPARAKEREIGRAHV